jgi:hypothetical protein
LEFMGFTREVCRSIPRHGELADINVAAARALAASET